MRSCLDGLAVTEVNTCRSWWLCVRRQYEYSNCKRKLHQELTGQCGIECCHEHRRGTLIFGLPDSHGIGNDLVTLVVKITAQIRPNSFKLL
jgi:hypothetical protein